MKIIKLTESDLQRIVKKVVNEQLVSDYKDIVNFLSSQKGKGITKINSNKFEFKNPDGSAQYVEISDTIKTYTKDSKGLVTNVIYPKNLDELKRIMSPEF
jgi:hypothetical protein